MSIRLITAVWEYSPYKGSQLLVHLALADHANDQGYCYPSRATLARKARISISQAKRSVRRLVDDKYVKILRAGVGRKATVYQVLDPRGVTHDPLEGSPMTPLSGHSYDPSEGAPMTPQRGHSYEPPTVIEPSYNRNRTRKTRSPKTEDRLSSTPEELANLLEQYGVDL